MAEPMNDAELLTLCEGDAELAEDVRRWAALIRFAAAHGLAMGMMGGTGGGGFLVKPFPPIKPPKPGHPRGHSGKPRRGKT